MADYQDASTGRTNEMMNVNRLSRLLVRGSRAERIVRHPYVEDVNEMFKTRLNFAEQTIVCSARS